MMMNDMMNKRLFKYFLNFSFFFSFKNKNKTKNGNNRQRCKLEY